ncbi:hypothetical protein ACIBH1_26300 [Nonomuraea sp. NPDC050663]|uniref:hypothetical protein n=1 Tax=Nonomuraea sp. NPDC050663 TaxID=3364370 RepID=UPI0037884A60
MYVIRLADGTLRVPQSVTSEDGRLIGNAYVELAPDDPDYDKWVGESVTEEELAERQKRWAAENDELEREFQEYKAQKEAQRESER